MQQVHIIEVRGDYPLETLEERINTYIAHSPGYLKFRVDKIQYLRTPIGQKLIAALISEPEEVSYVPVKQ